MIRHCTYLAVLAGCLLGACWLELWPGTGVYRRLGRLAQAVLPTFVAFTGWDLYAISRHHWSYDPGQTVGLTLPGGLPLEEVLFFLVVPTCAVLALEAVRRVTGWPTGEEPPPSDAAAAEATGTGIGRPDCSGTNPASADPTSQDSIDALQSRPAPPHRHPAGPP